MSEIAELRTDLRSWQSLIAAMARYKVILAYDGTHFLGFQRQGEAEARTVQGGVGKSPARSLAGRGAAILAAGRTDTGVHASGQVIAFDLDWPHSPRRLLAALNANLPADVAVQSVSQVAAVIFIRATMRAGSPLPLPDYCQPAQTRCVSALPGGFGLR